MVRPIVRATHVGAFLGSIALASCASAFHRTEIAPPARANLDATNAPYVQVRELAVSHKVVPFHFIALSQHAVTVDARNRSYAPVILDLANATLDIEHICNPTRAHVPAVASGLGNLPERFDPEKATREPLTIGRDEDRTFWIVFERTETTSGCLRVSLTLPTTNGAPIFVRVLDQATASPIPSARHPGSFGLTIGIEEEDFGGDADLVKFREGFWYARGAIKGGLTLEVGRLFERSPVGFQKASSLSAGFSLSWRPPLVTGGLFAEGHLTHATFENSAILGDRGWPDLSVGLEVPLQPGTLPVAFARLGYTHVFDDRTPYRDAFLFSIDVRYAIW
jgi:hypothetical protein